MCCSRLYGGAWQVMAVVQRGVAESTTQLRTHCTRVLSQLDGCDAGCWRLYGGAWQFMAVMQRAAEGLASLSPPATPRAARPPEATPTPSSASFIYFVDKLPPGCVSQLAGRNVAA